MPSLSQIARDYALPVGSAVAGGILNRRAASSATNRLTDGANTAMGTINTGATNARRTLADVYGEQKGLLDPYREAGRPALDTLAKETQPGGEFVKPFNADTFKLYEDPGFQFRLKEGQRAIEAGANAGGIRFSGATLKALSQFNQESASQEYGAARGRAVDDQTRAYERTRDMTNLGYDAASKQVDAGGTYGANLSNLETGTARSLADLQTDLASAEAMGDVAKANSITQTINGIMSGVENVGTAKSLASIFGGGGAAAGGAGAALSAGLSAATPTAASVAATLNGAAAAGIPGFSAVGAGGAAGGGSATGISGALGLGGGSGMFGLGALTIPVIGAGIAAAAYFVPKLFGDKKAQAAANDLTKPGGIHDEIKQGIAAINASPDLNPQQKKEAGEALARRIEDELVQFSKKDKHAYYKAKETLQAFAKWGFGVRPLLG